MISDIENTNLQAHVSICEQRYLNLDNRMTRLDRLLGEIHSKIDGLSDKQISQTNSVLIYVIGILLTICGALISKVFF